MDEPLQCRLHLLGEPLVGKSTLAAKFVNVSESDSGERSLQKEKFHQYSRSADEISHLTNHFWRIR